MRRWWHVFRDDGGFEPAEYILVLTMAVLPLFMVVWVTGKTIQHHWELVSPVLALPFP